MAAPKGTPTRLNLRCLGNLFGQADRVPNKIEPTSATHLRRCLRAGLFTVDGQDLVLTPAGRTALDDYAASLQ